MNMLATVTLRRPSSATPAPTPGPGGELVVNGAFTTNASSWTAGHGSYDAGNARWAFTAGSGAIISQVLIDAPAPTTYVFTFTYAASTQIRCLIDGVLVDVTEDTAGTFNSTKALTAGPHTLLITDIGGTSVGWIDNVSVKPAVTLGALGMTGSLTKGVAASGVTLTGLTDGSTVAFNIAGISVGTSGTSRTVTGTPTGDGSLDATETLAGATNTPRTSTAIASVFPAFTVVRANGYRGSSMSRTWSVGASQTSFTFRRAEMIMHRCDQIGLGFLNFATLNSGEGTNGAAVNIVKMAIECNGVTVPILFSAGRATTIASGSTGFASDYLSASAFGLSMFTADTPVFIRGWGTYAASATGLTVDHDCYNSLISGEHYSQFVPGSSGEDQVDATGAMTTPTGATLTPVFVPATLLCRVEAGKPSLVVSVDSLGTGYQDFTYDMTGNSGGPFRRVQHLVKKPVFLLGCYGMQMSGWGSKQTAVLANGWFYGGYVGERKGNDLTNGASLATMQTRVQTEWTAAAAASLPIYETKTGYPNVPGNYLCTDTANQVKATGCGVGGIGDQFNTWLDTKVSDLTITGSIALPAYDAANKLLVPGRTYTLNGAVAANATSISVSGASPPVVGDTLVIDPGVSTKFPFAVCAVTGSGPWTCTRDATKFPTPNNLAVATATQAKASGVAVAASYCEASVSSPETHFNPVMYGMLANTMKLVAPFV